MNFPTGGLRGELAGMFELWIRSEFRDYAIHPVRRRVMPMLKLKFDRGDIK